MTAATAECIQIVGDDLLVTNPKFVARGVAEKSCTAALIKLSQIGTVNETSEAINLYRKAGWEFVLSHRSGEAKDAFMADFAVATGGSQIETGSMCLPSGSPSALATATPVGKISGVVYFNSRTTNLR